MAFRHQHIRSSQKGRRPNPNDLLDGQLAVNFGDDNPGVFWKSETGKLIKAGPVHIGANPPDLLSGYDRYSYGELWFDTVENVIKIWRGADWKSTSPGGTSSFGVGAEGQKGEPGVKGASGYDGQRGIKGAKGEPSLVPGPTGQKGLDGVKGERGDKGSVGESGADGTSVKLTGAVADLAALNAIVDPAVSDLYVVVDDGSGTPNVAYLWDGAAWVDMGAIVGPKGEVGDKGEKGEVGEKGEKLLFSDLIQPDIDAITGPKGEPGEKGEKMLFSDLTAQEVVQITGDKGSRGDTIYQSAVSAGAFVGTEADFILSLKGDSGVQGQKGATGQAGHSNYDIAVANGFSGTESSWLETLKGEKGEAVDGVDGQKGDQGLSAYDVAKEAGFVGDEVNWLSSLRGDKGDKSFVSINDSFPAVKAKGDFFYLETNETLYIWDGADWKATGGDQILVRETAPDPVAEQLKEGTLWWNSDTSSLQLHILFSNSGSLVWVEAAPNVAGSAGSIVLIQPTTPAPDNLDEGTLWWNSDSSSLQLYVLYLDTASGTKLWVEASPNISEGMDLNYVSKAGSNMTGDLTFGPVLGPATSTVSSDGSASFASVDAAELTKSGVSLTTTVDVDNSIASAIAPLASTVDLNTAIAPLATSAELSNAIADLVDSSPGTLNTLNELAAALGDDPNFATTLAGQLAEVNTDVTALNSALGIGEDDVNMGEFVTPYLTDDITVKSALEEFGTALASRTSAVDAALALKTDQTATDAIDTRVTALENDPGTDAPVLLTVHNNTGGTLLKGRAVYISGEGHGDGIPYVAYADKDNAAKMPAIGLLYEDLADGSHGSVIVSGKLIGLNTSTPGWSVNDALYVSNSGTGTLTNSRPLSASEKVQKVAIVIRSDATEGSLLIMGAGRSNDVPNELTSLTGVSLNAVDLGTFTGATISDNGDIKAALQELETAVETKASTATVTEIDANVDDLVTLSGVAENTANLGTFTGAVISDNTTVKTALQELETEVETNITQAALHSALGILSYADDATAQGAGLSNGDIYYNTTTSRLRAV